MWLCAVVVLERRKRDSEEPDRPGDGHLVVQQRDGQLFEIAAARDRDGNGPAARDDLEIVELHLQRHRSTARSLVLAMSPDLVDQRLQFGRHGLESGEVAGKRVLGADRLPDPVRADLAVVDAPRDPVVVRAGLGSWPA